MREYKFSDLIVGTKESFEIIVSQRQMELFAELSGDFNPLHTDRDYAKNQGFEDRVVYGLLSTSFYSQLAGMYLPGKYCLLHGVDTTFLKPVYVGDKLRIEGEVSYINEAYRRVEIKASIFKINSSDSGGGGD